MIRVFIIADSPIVQAGLAAIVKAAAALTVAGSASQIPQQWQQLKATAVEVILVSAELSEETLGWFAPLLNAEPTVPVVWLIDAASEGWISEAVQSGVAGILPSDATAREIVAAVEAVTAGLVVLHPDLTSSLGNSSGRSLLSPAHSSLTQREVEILQMLAAGMANKTIARELHISEHTVKFHVSSIFAKLDVSSRTEAVTLGIRQGLVLL